MVAVQDPGTAASGYPVRLEVERPASQSRLTNFPLGIGLAIRAVLLIPHFFILAALYFVVYVLHFIAEFGILFSGKYPPGMFNFLAGVQRWSANLSGYMYSLYDNYPPFSSEYQPGYPATLTIDYPASSSRLLNFPLGIGSTIRAVLLIPHLVVLVFVGIVAYVIMIIAPFGILFTGSFPEGMHRFMTGLVRWGQRISAYLYGLTDQYPPFGFN